MELVGPRTRDHVHLTADRASVLRRQDALGHLHLGDRFDAQDLDLVLAAVIAEAAIFWIGLGAAAVHRDGVAAIADAVDAERPAAAGGVVGGADSRAEEDDVLQVPPRDRNLAHFLAERLHLRRRCCLDEGRILGDRDGLCQRPHFEPKCLPHRLAGVQRQSPVLIRLES